MRVAVLADIHGNLPALRAVLSEVDGEHVDALVVAGDVVGGPCPRDALELLMSRAERLVWIRGNAEREAVAAWGAPSIASDETDAAASWTAQALDPRWRDEFGSWPVAVTLDGVTYCHGSPRRDDEVLTRITPEAVLRDALGDAGAPMVVGGHTHQQTVRTLSGAPTYVNAGSVGMPYEGRAGAFWLLIDGSQSWHRETSYDLDVALEELKASGFPEVEELLKESLIEPIDPQWVAEFFEHGAGRRPDPGPPPGPGD
ncbi:MAG: metallophosphoesterase family protein [Solirubrobacteraceae bacterium]